MKQPQSSVSDKVPDPSWADMVAQGRDKPWFWRLLMSRGAALYLRYRLAYQRLSRLRPGQLRRLQRRLGLTLAGAALLLALSSGPIFASPNNTITVDGVNCTLADAITAANSDAATGGCDAGSGADILDITADIALTSVLPRIESDVTI
ncbi:MAG TPA: hypothetical protein G4N94_06405, partial [Caldilineae bacterium]|nr:hypothetical protein [Caldilineae bacterium]